VINSLSKSQKLLSYWFRITALSILFFIFQNQTFGLSQFNSPASYVIGQSSLEQCNNAQNGGSTLRGIQAPIFSLPLIYSGKLVIPNGGSSKLMIFNSIPTTNGAAPDVVLGVPDKCVFINYTYTDAKSFKSPVNANVINNKFYVVDRDANRILVYNNGIPSTDFAPADYALGQPDLTSNTANNGGISAHSLNSPYQITSDGTKLIVSDNANNRVLIWNTIPTSSTTDADVVIGQANFTASTANQGGSVAANTLNGPRGVFFYQDKLYVADYGNHRVLVWNSIPGTSNKNADFVIGQPNLNSNTANNGGVAANRLNNPAEISASGTKLFIGDRGNNRILIFNTLPTDSTATANVAVGQANMTSNGANQGGSVGANTLNSPYGAISDGQKFVVMDYNNYRVLIWNSIPTSNNASADVVIEQDSLSTNNPSIRGTPTATTLSSNMSVTSDESGRVFSSDLGNNRVLVWNSIPQESGAAPDYVLGQPNFTSNTANNGGISATSINQAQMAKHKNGKFFIADTSNNRILIWNTLPLNNTTSADLVLGQNLFTTNTANNGGISAKSLSSPTSLDYDGTHIVVADNFNNRILIWNSFPDTSFKTADVVLGQALFTTNTANNGGRSATSLAYPRYVQIYEGKLIATDPNNNRILIWNTIPTLSNTPADVVVGQQDFTLGQANHGATTPDEFGFNTPWYAFAKNGRLFVSEIYNHRIMGYNSIPTQNYVDADFVIGQTSYNSFYPKSNSSGLQFPTAMSLYEDNLLVSDYINHRILIFKTGPTNPSGSMDTYNTNLTVPVYLSGSDSKDVMISETSDFSLASWQTFQSPINYTFSSASEGNRSLYLKFRDYGNYESSALSVGSIVDLKGPRGTKISINKKNSMEDVGDADITVKERRIKIYFDTTSTITNVKYVKVSEHKDMDDANWQEYDGDMWINLSKGDEKKRLYFKFKDEAGNESDVYQQLIKVDTTAPAIDITQIGTFVPDFEKYKNFIYTEENPRITLTTEKDAMLILYVDGQEDIKISKLNENTNTSGVFNTTCTQKDGPDECTTTLQPTKFTWGNHEVTLLTEDSASHQTERKFNMTIDSNY
jgi:hypothetical protein